MISDSAYFLMINGAIATSSTISTLPPNVAIVVNGGNVPVSTSLPTNAILLNGPNTTVSSLLSSTESNTTASNIERPFVCEVCGNKYKSKPGLNYHRIHGHQDTQVKAVSSLRPVFHQITSNESLTPVSSTDSAAETVAAVAAASTSSLNNLLNSCVTRPYICEACGAKYKSKPGLNYHRLHVHLDPPKNNTMVADNSYAEILKAQAANGSLSESALGIAVSDIDRPYICEICGAKYKSKPGLAYHRIRAHQDEKPEPFVCQFCGASYKSKPGLAYHRLHAHPEINVLKSS